MPCELEAQREITSDRTKVNTSPIFLSNTLRRANRFLSGASHSKRVCAVICASIVQIQNAGKLQNLECRTTIGADTDVLDMLRQFRILPEHISFGRRQARMRFIGICVENGVGARQRCAHSVLGCIAVRFLVKSTRLHSKPSPRSGIHDPDPAPAPRHSNKNIIAAYQPTMKYRPG